MRILLRPSARGYIAVGVCLATSGAPRRAAAQATIQRPGDRASYSLELEPHVLATPFNPPSDGGGGGFGGGLRASFEVLHVGFVPSINDSIAVGVGTDFVRYQGNGRVAGVCTRYAPGPANTNVCVEVSGTGGPTSYAFLPVTMQWNFWLAKRWSVFGEPGLMLYFLDYRSLGVYPAFYAGGRFQILDWLTLTVRIGYPTLSLGLSFML